jgi:hypothetical protein
MKTSGPSGLANPLKVYTDIKASPTAISTLQPDSVQPTPTIQSTTDSQALPPTARVAPTRDEIPATFDKADQSQTEIREPSAEASFKQYQAWAAEEDARVQAGSVQPVQDAQEQVVQNAPAQVRPMQKHRHVQPVQNAQAEIRPEPKPRAKVRGEQNARAQVAPRP